jgi:hypothetical protein
MFVKTRGFWRDVLLTAPFFAAKKQLTAGGS